MTLFLCTKRFNYVQLKKNRNVCIIVNRSSHMVNHIIRHDDLNYKSDQARCKRGQGRLRITWIKLTEKWGHVEYGGQKICIGQNSVCYSDKCLN